MENDNLVYYGGEVKALGDGKIAGYLVRYGTPRTLILRVISLTRRQTTELRMAQGFRFITSTALDATIKNRKIGKGTIRIDDVGLWLEAQLEMRDDYERAIYGMAETGKLGWSSGAAGHLVNREQVGKSWRI